MKTFTQWLEAKSSKNSNLTPNDHTLNYIQNVGYHIARQVRDESWHKLYDIFLKQYQQFPGDPQVMELGKTLHDAASYGNMGLLQPFKHKYLYSKKIKFN